MTKSELLKYIEFDTQKDAEEASFYIDVKGIALHRKIMEYLNFDFCAEKSLNWKKISGTLRRDKGLRDALYIYLAALEEYVRAYISNKYQNNIQQSFWINGKSEHNKIKKNIELGKPLFDVLQNTDFGTLISQVSKLPPEDREYLFENNSGTQENLKAVKELRNAVSHHKFLLNYSFHKCEVNGTRSNSLEQNVRNLRQLLPSEYRFGYSGKAGLTKAVAKCGVII